MFVYLAGPIRQVNLTERLAWRANLSSRLARYGVPSFNPAKAWSQPDNVPWPDPVERRIQVVNDLIVFHGKLILASLILRADDVAPSIGTDWEILLAKNLNFPIFLYAPYVSKEKADAMKSEIDAWKDARGFPPDHRVYFSWDCSFLVDAITHCYRKQKWREDDDKS